MTMLGHKHSLEAKAKIAESNRRRVISDKQREKMSASMLQHYKSHPETREKIANKMRGRKQSEETCEKKSVSHTGKTLSESHKANIKIALNKPDVRRKISEAISGEKNPNRGKARPPDVRAKISASEKGRVVTPEEREKKRAAMYNSDGTHKRAGKNHPMWGTHPSEETRKKLSESHKGEKCHMWKGGVSFAPYCAKFDKHFKEGIREKFNRMCFVCGSDERTCKHAIHHIDYNKTAFVTGKSGHSSLYAQNVISKQISIDGIGLIC